MFYPTLMHHYLELTAEQFPDKEALICDKQRLTFRQIDEQTDRIAFGLINLGLKPHDRVAVFLDNCPETVLAIYGTSKASGVFVVLNSSLKSQKLAHILDNCQAKFLITHISKARIAVEATERIRSDCRIIWVSPSAQLPTKLPRPALSWNSLVQNDNFAFDPPAEMPWERSVVDKDLACLIYTSGSTGIPKGVMVPHANMLSAARSILSYLNNTSDDVILNVLPLSFGYGLYQVIMSFMVGGTIILEKSLVYMHNILKRIAEERATVFPFVPTIMALMLQLETIEDYDFSCLRYVTNAGAALPVAHIRRLRKLMPKTKIFSMYGLTECVRVSYLEPDQIDYRPDSVGKPIPNCQAFVADQNGREVEPDCVGELVVRGSNVMPGYWRDPKLSGKVYKLDRDTQRIFLHTGDFFRRDEQGYLYFVGRKDDMIKTRGERVSPVEVENILGQMEQVAETAVIGVPHDMFGQAVKAFVVPMPGQTLEKSDLLVFCNKNMENFMVPRYIEIVENLPKNPNGKIDKKLLKDVKVTRK